MCSSDLDEPSQFFAEPFLVPGRDGLLDRLVDPVEFEQLLGLQGPLPEPHETNDHACPPLLLVALVFSIIGKLDVGVEEIWGFVVPEPPLS